MEIKLCQFSQGAREAGEREGLQGGEPSDAVPVRPPDGRGQGPAAGGQAHRLRLPARPGVRCAVNVTNKEVFNSHNF